MFVGVVARSSMELNTGVVGVAGVRGTPMGPALGGMGGGVGVGWLRGDRMGGGMESGPLTPMLTSPTSKDSLRDDGREH